MNLHFYAPFRSKKSGKWSKLLSLFLCLLMTSLCLCSCASGDKDSNVRKAQDETQKESQSSVETPFQEVTEAETEEQTYEWQTEDFVFYFQDNDQPWSDAPHGGSTVAKSGCGTVSLAMCLATLTGNTKKYTPAKLAAFEKKHSIQTPNVDVDCIPTLCTSMHTGCHAELFFGDLDLDLVDETLEAGGYIILDQQADTGNKKNTQVFGHLNHYIVIRKGNQQDGYYIANSLYGYSKPKSKAKYAPQNGTCIPASMFCAKYYYTVMKDD